MKIAIVAPSGVPYAVGGAEKLWWGLLDTLRHDSTHEVELIKVRSPESNFAEIIASYWQFSGLDLSHFDLVISTKYPAWMVWHHNHYVYLQHTLRGLYDTYPDNMLQENEHWPEPLSLLRELLSRPPEHQHLGGLFDELENLRVNLPPEQWDAWFVLPCPLTRQIVHWLDSVALRPGSVKKFMAISHTVRAREDYFPTEVPVQVIHHPSDLEPAECLPGKYLFTVSRFDHPKRLDLLIRAMALVNSDVNLLIAGTGPQEQALKDLARGDKRIQFLGRVDDKQLRKLYSRALLVPFLPADEDYGLITVEAMQAGKPVLTTTDSGGVTELVEEGISGWVVEPTVEALANAIDQKLVNRPQLAAMADNCRRRVQSINWANTLSAILSKEGRLDERGILEAGKPNHIVVAVSFPVYPPRTGGQCRIFQIYRHMARYTPVTLVTLCNAEEAAFDKEIAPGLREIRVPKTEIHQLAEREKEAELGASIGDVFAIENMELTPKYLHALRGASERASLVVASHPYLYPAIRQTYRGPMLYEAHNVEYDMKREILGETTLSQAWLDLTLTTEQQCCKAAVGIAACSEEDRQRLVELYKVSADTIVVIPNGVSSESVPNVDIEVRRRIPGRLPSVGQCTALFLGSWHGPNIDAVRFIIDSLAPASTDIDFWVVGSVCHYKFGPLPDNVYFLGQLSDADKDAVLSCAQIAVNPMSTGSGTNLKMAEYAAAGLPTLTTPHGCRGLAFIPGEHVIEAELTNFPKKLHELVNQYNGEALNHIVDGARSLAIERHDWKKIADRYYRYVVKVGSR